jgi:hypothetical protein
LLLKDTFFLADILLCTSTGSVASARQHRIAATPTHRYRPYRSKRATTAETTSWVQIDLGAALPITSVMLYPANQRTKMGADAYYSGEAFPVRFKVEASGDSDFARPRLIANYASEDFENPKDAILNLTGANIRARYVRLTASKFAEPECRKEGSDAPDANTQCSSTGAYYFALSKIAVISEGKDVAVGQPSTADEMYGNPDDLEQLTRQERVETEYVHHDRIENVSDPSTWSHVPYVAQAPSSGVTLQGGVFESTMRNNIRYLLDSFTLDDLLLQFQERAGKPIPPKHTHKPDKFWEEDLAGSNAGRFLMGAGNTLRWIDDPELRSRFNGVMDGIVANAASLNGWVMAFPEDTIFYSERGAYTRAWLTHGLIEAGYAGDPRAFDLLRGQLRPLQPGHLSA